MTKQLMKLYVWEDVPWDYSHGMIVALAPDMETALALARDSRYSETAAGDMGKTEPEVTDLGWVNSKPKLWLVLEAADA